MEKKELEIIKELMDKLSDEMEYGEEDFMERLGKKKPEVKVVKMEGKLPFGEDELEMEEDCEMCKGHGCRQCEEEEMELPEMFEEEEESEEDELKRRLMQLRS